MIGIYTDVKIPILLAGLRARYLIPNLAVSDTLTASRGLERQLVGLDFADKLLGVEVIHGIEDLAAYVGSEVELEDESKLVAAPDFQQFRSYFADKQNVLAHQTERLDEYQQLTERRSIRLYRMIAYANAFLLIIGGAFLLLALVSSILSIVSPDRFPWQIAAVTGGLGLGGLVAVFFTRPIKDLQQNLNNLASFKMILEGHSLKEAFTRYHLTTPEVLREVGETERTSALLQIEALREQLAVIDESQKSDYDALGRVVGVRAREAERPVGREPGQAGLSRRPGAAPPERGGCGRAYLSPCSCSSAISIATESAFAILPVAEAMRAVPTIGAIAASTPRTCSASTPISLATPRFIRYDTDGASTAASAAMRTSISVSGSRSDASSESAVMLASRSSTGVSLVDPAMTPPPSSVPSTPPYAATIRVASCGSDEQQIAAVRRRSRAAGTTGGR